MINVERLSEKIFGVIKGIGYALKMYDEDGNATVDPSLARRFFVADPGFMVTVNYGDNEVQFNKGAPVSLVDTVDLQTSIKRLANEFLLNYTVREFGKRILPKDFSHEVKRERGNEMSDINEASLSKLDGSGKTSYQRMGGVKILVKHKDHVDETKRGARSRGIQGVFLEHGGKRVKFPHNSLLGARAMAMHLFNGGDFYDAVGQSICENTGNLVKLVEFQKYTKSNSLVNEGTSEIIEALSSTLTELRMVLKSLAGSKSYPVARSKIETATEVTSDVPVDSIRDLMTVKSFDTKFDDILPLIGQVMAKKNCAHNRIEDASSRLVTIIDLPMQMESIASFTSESAKMGHRLSELAVRVVGNNELADFLKEAAKKLHKGADLSPFERKVVRNAMSNIKVADVVKRDVPAAPTELAECTDFAKRLDRYGMTFFL